MNLTILFIILGMAIVTYIPRVLPLVFFDATKLPQPVQAILKNVPYAALGALIFPGILLAHDQMLVALAGGVVAITVSLLGFQLLTVVLASIATVMLTSLFF